MLLALLGFGFAGWLLENAFFGPRYSKAFGGAEVPFLPVYAIGGMGVLLAAPKLAELPWPFRAAIYAAGSAALQEAACRVDRALPGPASWAYGQAGACTDVAHTAAWTALAMLVEQAFRKEAA